MRRSMPVVLCLVVLISATVRLRAGDIGKHRQTLDKLVTIKVEDATLREIVDSFSEQTGVTIRINESEVAAILDVDGDPLSANLMNLPLRSVLKFIFSDELMWQVRDGELTVTTSEIACEVDLDAEFFDVLDLVRGGKTTTPDDYDYDSVIQLITSTIDPDTWDEFGGRGSVRRIRGLLMISNRRDTLDKIPALLSGFRKARKLAETDDSEGVSVPLSDSPTEVVNRALARPFDLDFNNVPLSEVVSSLQDEYAVTVVLNRGDIATGQIDPEAPVTLAAEMQPLHEVLNRLTDSLSVEYSVRDGAIVIEEYHSALETRAYPVSDLLGEFLAGDEFDDHRREFGYDDLVDLTTSSVAADSWDAVGGTGSMIPLPEHGLLIVSQSWSRHRLVEGFLTKLRKELAGRPRVADRPAKKHSEQTRLAVYIFATPVLEEQRRKEEAAEQKKRKQAESAKEQPNEERPRKRKATPPRDDLPPGRPERERLIDPFGEEEGDPFGGGEDGVDPFAPGRIDVAMAQFDEGGFGGGFGGSGGIPEYRPPFYARELPITEEQLVKIITGVIEPTSWVRDEGTFISAAHGRIVVRHTNAVHDKIQELAKRLRIMQFREFDPTDDELDGFGGGFGGGPDGGGFF